jgi:hypothetical protein
MVIDTNKYEFRASKTKLDIIAAAAKQLLV